VIFSLPLLSISQIKIGKHRNALEFAQLDKTENPWNQITKELGFQELLQNISVKINQAAEAEKEELINRGS